MTSEPFPPARTTPSYPLTTNAQIRIYIDKE